MDLHASGDPSAKKRPYDEMELESNPGKSRKASPVQKVHTVASPDEHKAMDELVRGQPVGSIMHLAFIPEFAPLLLSAIVVTCPKLNQSYALPAEAAALTRNHLTSELQRAWEKKSFSEVRDMKFLLAPPPPNTSYFSDWYVPFADQIKATVASWQVPYENGSVKLFLKTIGERLDAWRFTTYGQHFAVVQSSGTGKSRMLHEASGEVFSVIMNFGKEGTSGYPKPDRNVRDYLTNASTAQKTVERAIYFFIALFDELSNHAFPTPSHLQSFLGYGDQTREGPRAAFFNSVIQRAALIEIFDSIHPPTGANSFIPQIRTLEGQPRSLMDAATDLSAVLAKFESNHQVKLILAFDSASETNTVPRSGLWDPFTEIGRVLAVLRKFQIFTVFVSTTSSVRRFSPCEDQSAMHVYERSLDPWPPFSLLGFDQLATKMHEGGILDDATDPDFLLGLGRPMFKTRYCHGSYLVRDTIVGFAVVKLLNGSDGPEASRRIAPLAIRLPLEFNALTESGRAAEQAQVDSHMRLCLKISADADVMYAFAPSEPVLIEAAIQVMGGREFERRGASIDILHNFLSDRYLSQSDRGELACMLLMLLARDHVTFNVLPTRVMRHHKPIRVTDFLTALFAKDHQETILEAKTNADGKPLQEEFKDSWLHFTHFIKVTDHKVVHREYLMRMMARGAAVLCADNQLGIDAIIPVCYKGKELRPDNITAILVQNKNIFMLRKSQPALFANMDPEHVGVFEKGSKDELPVIKIILSVGTPLSALTCPSNRKTAPAQGTASLPPSHFELFAAGMSHKTFGPIVERDEAKWKELVPRTGMEDMYMMHGNSVLLGAMNPCAQSDSGHWDAFFPVGESGASNVEGLEVNSGEEAD